MKLEEHVDLIREQIDSAIQNRFGRLGIHPSGIDFIDRLNEKDIATKDRIMDIFNVTDEKVGHTEAYDKLVGEFTFTLFNRLVSIKVMESYMLYPEIITKRSQHGDRSFAHLMWLEQHSYGRKLELDGLLEFMEEQFEELSIDNEFFSASYSYHILPTTIELNNIITLINEVEQDEQVGENIWKTEDILGQLYENYNNFKKTAHKSSGNKTEYNKVSIQSQIYTPRWVVELLVNNSLGKMYLEMYPDSSIKEKYKIIGTFEKRVRETKPLHEIKVLDPCTGSGNFLLYCFDLFYLLYKDQINNYGADYDEVKIPELIIKNNLYGIDLDSRAIQLARIGLFIKARRIKRKIQLKSYNIVSTDFMLPDFSHVEKLFGDNSDISYELKNIVKDIWIDLQKAYKFGSLIQIEEKFNSRMNELEEQYKDSQLSLFDMQARAEYAGFRESFFETLSEVVVANTEKNEFKFVGENTEDALVYLNILTNKYDVVVTNPPYTDSADFGNELKNFIENNYKNPFNFSSNLYAAFIKRNYEFTVNDGYMALVHPMTFMYIKTFEDVRKFIINNMSIKLFVEYGLSNLFGSTMVDPAFYVLKRVESDEDSCFISLDQFTRTPEEKHKKYYCIKSLEDFISGQDNENNYIVNQNNFKKIEGWPFIYNITGDFREKFKEKSLDKYVKNSQGMSVSYAERFLRYYWEVSNVDISFDNENDGKKWVPFEKGGPYNKWYGNNWLVVNWYNNGAELKAFPKAAIRNESYYFKEGITYSSSGSKGASFRYMPKNFIFSGGGPGITTDNDSNFIYLVCGFLNSNISRYLLECLNPTVNTTQGDLNRLPFVMPNKEQQNIICDLVKENIRIKKELCTYSVKEINYSKSPIEFGNDVLIKNRIYMYIVYESLLTTKILINESVINNIFYKVYDIDEDIKIDIDKKVGLSVGSLPVFIKAKDKFLDSYSKDLITTAYINSLNVITTLDYNLKDKLSDLYQKNNNFEEFCIKNIVNPINLWFLCSDNIYLPSVRTKEITLEFLIDSLRNILQNSDDGILSITETDTSITEMFDIYCNVKGISSAQMLQIEIFLGDTIKNYMENNFFEDEMNYLNLFMYMPKTPFIWHLSSGEYRGFEAFIIIYKWNRDSLYKLKSNYISLRKSKLEYRFVQLKDNNTAQAQDEKELIQKQLNEIELFIKKIDELIAKGYNPVLDDGVGKNIAPLQAKGMLKSDVLNAKQLQKYLKADW